MFGKRSNKKPEKKSLASEEQRIGNSEVLQTSDMARQANSRQGLAIG
jgi:hypothetical protein